MWAIEEYAIIFRVCVWFSPPQAPMKIDEIARMVVMVGFRRWEIWNRMDRGAIFCQVSKIRPI